MNGPTFVMHGKEDDEGNAPVMKRHQVADHSPIRVLMPEVPTAYVSMPAEHHLFVPLREHPVVAVPMDKYRR